MKLITGAVAAVLGLTFSFVAKADEFQADAVCKTLSGNAGPNDTGYTSNASTLSEVMCGLKRVVCSTGGGCTYNATAWVEDGNSVDASDSNITCNLHLQAKQITNTTYAGSSVHTTTTTTLSTLSMSLSIPNGTDGWVFVDCFLSKDAANGDHSFITWIGNTNF